MKTDLNSRSVFVTPAMSTSRTCRYFSVGAPAGLESVRARSQRPARAAALDCACLRSGLMVREPAIKAVTKGFTHVQRFESVQVAVDALQYPDLNVRYVALAVLQKTAPEQVPSNVIRQIRGLIETDDELGIRRAAVKALGKIDGPNATHYLCDVLRRSGQSALQPAILETLYETGDPRAVATMVEVLERTSSKVVLDMIGSPWLCLLRIEFLGELLKFLPATKPIITRLSFAYDIRVLPDGSVVLSDGRRLSGTDAAHWLKVAR